MAHKIYPLGPMRETIRGFPVIQKPWNLSSGRSVPRLTMSRNTPLPVSALAASRFSPSNWLGMPILTWKRAMPSSKISA